ncbi:MAG: zinc ribbon domain-containing protein [Phycisphaeraceae bacterium]
MSQVAPESADATARMSLDDAIYCPHCGYDLRMLSGAACPECGGEVDLAALRKSQIPWTERRSIGRARALFGTAWRVSFHTRQFCQEMSRPVDYRQARRFQVTVVAWNAAWLGAAALVTLGCLWAQNDQDHPLWTAGIAALIGVPFFAATLLLITGVHTYWFHRRQLSVEQQNRALALGYYACAPLAYLPLIVVFILACVVGMVVAEEYADWPMETAAELLFVVGLGCLAGIPVAFWRTCLSMASHAARRESGAIVLMAITLPLLWLLLAGLILGLIPFLILHTWFIFRTL